MTRELRTTLGDLVGAHVWFQELKHKPGRRRTVRAVSPAGSVIVKVYESERAPAVAGGIEALSAGPAEPAVPRVLLCDPGRRMVVLSYVDGVPLSQAVLASNFEAFSRAGLALGAWHAFWAGGTPRCLRRHTSERELEVIDDCARTLPTAMAETVRRLARQLSPDWEPRTVIHRDLYEEQVLVGERIGLIDLDDAAVGPPELDVGNLLAHLELLALRAGGRVARMADVLLEGYAASGAILDADLLDRCRRLSLLRLVGIHREPRLLRSAERRRRGITAGGSELGTPR
jgi:Ser/Thr protein kinase RdoA (MazF antagonist)